MKIGAVYSGKGKSCFTVWAPEVDDMKLKIMSPVQKILEMNKDNNGYWVLESDNIKPGTDYFFRINNSIDLTDPASNYQPNDVHNASRVVDHSAFKWDDNSWQPPSLKDYIIYELHIGTFTPEGTFEAAIKKILYLKDLGINVVEIMPVSQFPGGRNWGYDGVYPFAPQNTYGGPDGLKNLVNALHKQSIAVLLDVVYNHLGPEGNYLNHFAPYFTDKYRTPWGNALNFDSEYSDHVRNYFINNAIYWLDIYHFDGLRLDAIDKIYDFSAKHFLAELSLEIQNLSERLGKKKILIAESDLNDERIIRPASEKGIGMDGQWSDDFHHALHTQLTGERDGYYIDFNGFHNLVESIRNGFVYNGKYSTYRKRRHGNDPSERDLEQFVVCIQNHDQVGNRAFGERLSTLIDYEAYKLASAALLLSPYIPLLFMGQEFFDEEPFIYFISHSNPELIVDVQKGRRKEFSQFDWSEDIPDPFAEETFLKSKIPWDHLNNQKNKTILNLYKELISYRKGNPLFRNMNRKDISVHTDTRYRVVMLHYHADKRSIFNIMNFEPETVTVTADFPEGSWIKVIDTSLEKWGGSGPSMMDNLAGKKQNITMKKVSFVLYEWE